ncbi:Cha4p PWA37_001353 [Arxiozyma heterogenica]|uniref:Cha4p n=1 Tax=Arxiozyma heterogenica TaxID=278026 RepID=UPI002F03A198
MTYNNMANNNSLSSPTGNGKCVNLKSRRGGITKLACLNCRQSRKKCDMEKPPCLHCAKKNLTCVIPETDLRTRRKTVSYVNNLEKCVEQLQSVLLQIKTTTNVDQRNKLIDDISIIDENSPKTDKPLLKISNVMSNASAIINTTTLPIVKPLKKNIGVLGKNGSSFLFPSSSQELPTTETNSIYPSNSLLITKKDSARKEQENQMILKNLSRSPLILRSLSLFFKWLYPGHYMFIHRETFLSAFFGDPSTKAYYCSEELVYAIAALGARATPKSDELFTKSEKYYQHAKQIVLTKIFQLIDRSLAESTSSSKLAIIQTLLCLAFYDITRAENPMAWYLSGLAFRISHEIGLHLNPRAWNHVYEDELSKMDYAVRSRIYWGCYLADHLISVLFGRSTTLRMSNSSVPETDELPDIENGIEDYIFKPGVPTRWANPLKKLIYLSRISEVFATKIFTQTDSLQQRCDHLIKFNQEMQNWRDYLPDDIKWNKEYLENLSFFDPTVMYMWFHYYIVLISYNKPFISKLDESKKLIESYIEELHLLFKIWERNYPTFERCDLYMIYSAILCIQCMNTNVINKKYYKFFKGFLEDGSINYEVTKNFIENCSSVDNANNNSNNNNNTNNGNNKNNTKSGSSKYQDNNNNATNSNDEINTNDYTDLLGSLSNGNDFALGYNFDFTLLNEIDKLINNNSDWNNNDFNNPKKKLGNTRG